MDFTSFPSTLVISSPTQRPAFSAGLFGLTDSTVRVPGVRRTMDAAALLATPTVAETLRAVLHGLAPRP